MLTYTSTKWVNGSGSPLNATNLNNIETGIDALVGAVNTIEGTVEAHGKEIAGLKTVDATNATNIDSNKQNIATLTTDLAATNTQVADHETRVDVLEATVGNSTTGLVKRVTTLETESATKVALKSATDRIGNLEATYASDTELLAVDTRLQADIDEVDERLKARIATAEQDIITLKNSTGGGGASTWEDLAGKPSAFTPTAHADGNAATYGAATESLYGHVKISNGDVHNTAHATGVAAGMDHTHSNYADKAFKSIVVGGATITADDHKDSVELVAGDNVTLSGDATNDKVTISAKDTTYTFTNKAATLSWGTTSTIATVGGTDITVKMPANPNTDTHHTAKNIAAASSTATANASATSNAVYFNLIENGAVRSSHKIAGSGSTKVGSDASGNITITTALTGGASTIESTNLTESRALVSNSSGKVAVSTVTSTELGYLEGVMANVQTQINNLATMLNQKQIQLNNLTTMLSWKQF